MLLLGQGMQRPGPRAVVASHPRSRELACSWCRFARTSLRPLSSCRATVSTKRTLKSTGGVRAVRVLRLPVIAELGNGAVLAVRDEHRVETEALGAARVLRDAPFERAATDSLLSVRAERNEHGH